MRMIIDTDAGIDDAEAILMALAYPDCAVEAITTVTGNVHLDLVNRNVATVLQQTGKTVPVYSGADRPLIEPWEHNEKGYHFADGLGDWDKRPPVEVNLEDEHAVTALIRLVNENPGELTLVALGPLTNIALAMRMDPTLPEKVREITVMGGAVDARGNTPTVSAEFNIRIDPEAAAIVFEAFPMVKLVTWETTLENVIPWDEHQRLCKLGTPLADFYAGMNAKGADRTYRNYKAHLLPDPLAMAVTLDPSLVGAAEIYQMSIELNGTHTRGMTVVNYTRFATGTRNVTIIRQVDMDGVVRLYERMLQATVD
ncbi:MAG: nucleoside hydrolase [Chloroflexota bacterium]